MTVWCVVRERWGFRGGRRGSASGEGSSRIEQRIKNTFPLAHKHNLTSFGVSVSL